MFDVLARSSAPEAGPASSLESHERLHPLDPLLSTEDFLCPEAEQERIHGGYNAGAGNGGRFLTTPETVPRRHLQETKALHSLESPSHPVSETDPTATEQILSGVEGGSGQKALGRSVNMPPSAVQGRLRARDNRSELTQISLGGGLFPSLRGKK